MVLHTAIGNGICCVFSILNYVTSHINAFCFFKISYGCFICDLLYVQVAKDPSGKEINALEQHIKNLLSPATPFFFNTLYDPYREGADFVRGYPFSLREGAPTAVSHGLWLNIPDYDAPTQLVKPRERNTRYETGCI